MDHSGIDKHSSKNTHISNSGMTRPSIELDDFFEYLDPKVVQKIMQTSDEEKARIIKGIRKYEYDIEGAKNILESLG